MKIRLSTGNSRMERIWNQVEMDIEAFAERISATHRTSETVAQYRKFSKARQDAIKDVGGYVLGTLKDGRRKKETVLTRSGLTLDMDYATPDVAEQLEMFFSFRCFLYSTHKHTPEKPRLRLIIPLSREVTPDEYCAVARKVAQDIGMELFDDTTYEPSRLMYWPSTSADGEFVYKEIPGDLLDPDTVLARYTDWHDSSEWPVSNRQQKIVQRDIKKQADPTTKPGLVGAFCRSYSIDEAIDRFLPDVYRHSAMNGRYDYIPADSQAGVVLYEGKFAYSHHATDPACGILMNAFDVVRIHKFGDLDAKADENTSPSKLPSFKAMQELASQDERVKETLGRERMDAANEEFEDSEWQKHLSLDKNGKVTEDIGNYVLILRYDENLQSIAFNKHRDGIDARETLPWAQIKDGWCDTDDAALAVYLNRVYGIYSPTKMRPAILAVAAERAYHPIQEYLESLPAWDGVERVDQLLVDYFGAEDTSYTRAVTRKTLVAAIARIYHPGTKFDSVLILNGPQGIGKSTLFAKLAGQWFSDSLAVTDMRDKSGPEKLQGYWILELGELAGMKKTDVETIKSFLSRNDDKYRASYGTNVESHPRQCVIVGSTNNENGFLRDITGNRRFWPVRISGESAKHTWDITDDDVAQIWAEALLIYARGEKLYLEGEDARLAVQEQSEAMEIDDREGLVRAYLDKLLPEGWDEMTIFDRRNFLGGSDFGSGGRVGVIQRTKVCNMEIWCECFGKEASTMKKTDSYELTAIMNRIGWKKYTGTKAGTCVFPIYGKQRAMVRPEQGTTGTTNI